MTNRYEALLVLDVKGSDEGAKEIIDRLEGAFREEGAAVEQIQRMGKHHFSYAAGRLDSGYYVNFIFAAEPVMIERLRARFRLDADIYRQTYNKLRAKGSATPPAGKEKVAGRP